jgi:hypothetical protein
LQRNFGKEISPLRYSSTKNLVTRLSDPILDKEIPMDDPKQIPILTEIAKNVDLSQTILWIQTHLYSDKYLESQKTK